MTELCQIILSSIPQKEEESKSLKERFKIHNLPPYTAAAIKEIILALGFTVEIDKYMLKKFFLENDVHNLLNLSKMQYNSETSVLAHRVHRMLRTCFPECMWSKDKEAIFDSALNRTSRTPSMADDLFDDQEEEEEEEEEDEEEEHKDEKDNEDIST